MTIKTITLTPCPEPKANDWTSFTSADGKVGIYKVENGMVHCEVQIDIHANQSAPADKGAPEDCAHSEANKHGCPECGEEFKP